MNDFESILSAASALPVADQLKLIDALSSGVPDDQPPARGPAWIAEINRRSDEIDRGEAVTQPWAEVKKRLRQKTGLDGAD